MPLDARWIRLRRILRFDELMKTTGTEHAYHAVFIRAPLIESVYGNAKVLSALDDGRIVAAQEGHCLPLHFTLN